MIHIDTINTTLISLVTIGLVRVRVL